MKSLRISHLALSVALATLLLAGPAWSQAAQDDIITDPLKPIQEGVTPTKPIVPMTPQQIEAAAAAQAKALADAKAANPNAGNAVPADPPIPTISGSIGAAGTGSECDEKIATEMAANATRKSNQQLQMLMSFMRNPQAVLSNACRQMVLSVFNPVNAMAELGTGALLSTPLAVPIMGYSISMSNPLNMLASTVMGAVYNSMVNKYLCGATFKNINAALRPATFAVGQVAGIAGQYNMSIEMPPAAPGTVPADPADPLPQK